MTPTPVPTRRRPAFTLIELLIVMAIIILLAALLAAAVMRTLVQGKATKDIAEINQLSQALGAFKSKFNLDRYPPSRLKLCSRLNQYGTTLLDKDSLAFLEAMFPEITRTGGPFTATMGAGIDWTGGTGSIPATGATLEGDQCLVFFLGGIPTVVSAGPPVVLAVDGFSTNPRNPAAVGGQRIPPFFDFPSDRLQRRAASTSPPITAASAPFPSYQDVYKRNYYAYFSSYKEDQGYNRYFSLFMNSDCFGLRVWPYGEQWTPATATTPSRYYKPGGFQIISAGANGRFGPGTDTAPRVWTPRTAGTVVPPDGQDDRSNFYDKPLGAPTN
jgi:type II secretory pathway pseudopilin PulG